MLSHLFRKLRSPPTEPLRVVRAAGEVWHFRSGAMDVLGGVPDLAEWQRRGSAKLVKQNLQRSIWRVMLPGGTIYLKQCRTNTPRAWMRDILRPPKARLEFENALALLSRGIGCIEPLAWGMKDGRWPGDSFIITREQANAVPLDAFLERPLTPLARRGLAVAFGEFLAKVRRGGVHHPDAHPGNFLIEWNEGQAPIFFLLDVHAVKTSPPGSLSEAERVGSIPDRHLLLLNRWFQMRASRTDRMRFWRAYNTAPTTLLSEQARDLESQTRKSNLRFWLNRLGRYLGNNREYRKVRSPGVRGNAVRELPEDLLSEWIADPDAIFTRSDATILKDSPSSTVALLPHGSRRYVFKRFRRNSLITGLKNRLRQSPALRSWIAGQSLRDRGLPTARPLAVLHRCRVGLPREGYLIFEFVADAKELPEAVVTMTWDERKQLADEMGRLIRDLHDRGVSHRDLKAPNILVVAGRPVLIDLVGVRLDSRAIPDSERVRNLARLNARFVNSSFVNRTDRLRVLLAYRSWSTRPPGDWKALWRAIGAETLAKVKKNRRAGRVLA